MPSFPDGGPIRDALRAHLRADPRLTPGAGVVVAVSGGPDSVALLRLLAALPADERPRLVVAHLDHGLRGAAGETDVAFVRALAESLGLPCRTARADVADTARREKRSLEDAARAERRRFLEEVRRTENATLVALGHTRDDQAETLLMNLLRGSGPRGLGAMPAHGPGPLTRPLIRVGRGALVSWLEAIGQPYRTDDTNGDPRFTRNRIRHDLLPRLAADYNPAILDTLARTAALFQSLDDFLETAAAAWLANPGHARCNPPDRMSLRLEPLTAAAPPLRDAVLRRAAQACGSLKDWGQVHIEALCALSEAGEEGRLDLPGGMTARRVSGWLQVAAEGAADEAAPDSTWPGASFDVRSGVEIRTPRGVLRVTRVPIRPGAPIPRPAGDRSALFDPAGFPPRLTVRPLCPGERIRPFGAAGHRKVVDILADRHVPASERVGWPVVSCCSKENVPTGRDGSTPPVPGLLWVAGARRGDEFPLRPDSLELIMLEWFGDPNDHADSPGS